MYMSKLAFVAAALLSGAYADVWANFCNDNACGGSCGEAVDVTNPGCLGETGRNSIAFGYSGFDDGQGYALTWYSDGGCANSVQCKDGFVPSSGCVDLNGNPFASSFQFSEEC